MSKYTDDPTDSKAFKLVRLIQDVSSIDSHGDLIGDYLILSADDTSISFIREDGVGPILCFRLTYLEIPAHV